MSARPAVIRVVRSGRRGWLEIDGHRFPYSIARDDAILVRVGADRVPGVTITLLADRVEVTDDPACEEGSEPA